MPGTSITALIDGDIIAYRAAYISDDQDLMDLQDVVDGLVEEWARHATGNNGMPEYLVCLSKGRSFRHDLCPDYKAHRKKQQKPKFWAAAREMLHEHPHVTVQGLEADDIMGIAATNGRYQYPVIVTIDKDLLQIPGYYVNPDKMEKPIRVMPFEGDYMFCQQWLTGDPTDGFKGIPGIGPKKAAKILENCDTLKEMINVVTRAYLEKGLTPEYCMLQARLARILRAEDWDNVAEVPKIWGSVGENMHSHTECENESSCTSV